MEKIDAKDNLIRLVQQYQNLIFSICLKLTGDYFAAEDLTQETFILSYQHYKDFDGKDEKAWLCRIASNKCIDYQRAAARRIVPTIEEELPVEQLIDHNEPLQEVLNREVLKELEVSCNALSLPYNTIAYMHFVEGKTAKEIAEQSGENVHSVQTKIYRAREKLRKSIRKELLKE